MTRQEIGDLNKRAVMLGEECVLTGKTVRQLATEHDMAKTIVHRYLTKRLPQINSELAEEVKKVLSINWQTKHIRGGEATKQMKLKRKSSL